MAQSKVRIELNSAGVAELLKSGAMLAAVDGAARRMAAAAGPGYEASSKVGSRRALAQVRAATTEARRREATDRRLTRSIDAGRS